MLVRAYFACDLCGIAAPMPLQGGKPQGWADRGNGHACPSCRDYIREATAEAEQLAVARLLARPRKSTARMAGAS